MLARGPSGSKRGGNFSIHHNGDSATAGCLFRIMISVDQFGVYGTVSDWCEELAQQISDPCSTITGKPVAELNDESETRVAPTVASIQPLINAAVQGNMVRQRNERFEIFQKTFE